MSEQLRPSGLQLPRRCGNRRLVSVGVNEADQKDRRVFQLGARRAEPDEHSPSGSIVFTGNGSCFQTLKFLLAFGNALRSLLRLGQQRTLSILTGLFGIALRLDEVGQRLRRFEAELPKQVSDTSSSALVLLPSEELRELVLRNRDGAGV
uniref:Uncharacterized protein n=1 Tax=Streptomyces sp. NBC_00003 TaxID=2903608 RepID=A0AAU2V6R7_9ACTN